MKSQLAALEELQVLDLENLKFHNELTEIPTNLKTMQGDVAHVGELLGREKDRLKEAELLHKQREKDIALQNELLAKSKAKLQSARNERENKAAQREIDDVRRNIQEREDETLKLMEAIEQYREAIEVHSKEFADLEEHLRVTEAEGKERMALMEAEIAKTADHRKALSARVPAQMLRLYERIRKRLGRAVVEAVDGKCLGCNLGILAQQFIELQRCEKLIQCPNCFRILVYKAPQEPENPEDGQPI